MLGAALLLGHLQTAGADADPVEVQVKLDEDVVLIDAVVHAPVTVGEAWAVLIDFDHMAEFLPNLQSSVVQSRTGNALRVAQKGESAAGPLSFSFDTVREIDLTPVSAITFHLISGTMEKLDGVTRLFPEGNGTRITYHAVAIPGHLLPLSFAESFIARDVRAKFQAFVVEMSRRRQVIARDQHQSQ
jgi:carbon monoxide dehydrogenase subunit G